MTFIHIEFINLKNNLKYYVYQKSIEWPWPAFFSIERHASIVLRRAMGIIVITEIC